MSGLVRVWLARLEPPGPEEEALLSPDERERAARLRTEGARGRFVRARALARHILGAHLGTDPAGLEFVYGAAGKPALAGASGGAPAFSWSHSGELFALALAPHGAVGVDVEWSRPVRREGRVAEFFLSPRERELWRSLPEGERLPALLRAWTRKEAVAKADGRGMAAAVRAAPVLLAAEAGSGVVELPDAPPLRWLDWSPPAGYLGAVAWTGPLQAVEVREWGR